MITYINILYRLKCIYMTLCIHSLLYTHTGVTLTKWDLQNNKFLVTLYTTNGLKSLLPGLPLVTPLGTYIHPTLTIPTEPLHNNNVTNTHTHNTFTQQYIEMTTYINTHYRMTYIHIHHIHTYITHIHTNTHTYIVATHYYIIPYYFLLEICHTSHGFFLFFMASGGFHFFFLVTSGGFHTFFFLFGGGGSPPSVCANRPAACARRAHVPDDRRVGRVYGVPPAATE